MTTKSYLKKGGKIKKIGEDTEEGKKLIGEAGKLSGMITGLIGKYEEQLKLMNREIKKVGRVIRVEKKGAREGSSTEEE
jgi:hypothetical protein